MGDDYFENNTYHVVLWILFFLLILVGQITLLNLLIAIISDVYDRVVEVS